MPKLPKIEQVPFLGALEAVGPRRMVSVNEVDHSQTWSEPRSPEEDGEEGL